MSTSAKTLATLEFAKVLARLAQHAAFSAGRALALALRPSSDYGEVVRRQRMTAEARRLLEMQPNLSLGGAHDVRPQAQKAALASVLEPGDGLCFLWQPASSLLRPSLDRQRALGNAMMLQLP